MIGGTDFNVRIPWGCLLLVSLGLNTTAQGQGDPARGYELLLNKAFLPPDFDQQTFDNVWRVWPQPLRSRAESASPAQRRHMAFERYGLDLRPNDPAQRPLQYVVSSSGDWSMNCFACHSGSLDGRVYPGLPNARYGLQTLTEDMRTVKLQLKKPLANIDLGSLVMPLGTTVGTTNAVMFGVVLLAKRDADLNQLAVGRRPQIAHHDMDAPAWWHFKHKSHIYIDGFAPKGHRGLMQFLLVKHNGPEKFREWEADFRHIRAYLESLQPPAYPFDVDRTLATRGLKVFQRVCSRCHGTYGDKAEWPEVVVPIDEIGTDRVRLDSISRSHRQQYAQSWFTDYGQQP
ncbi:MAG: cytochrome c, partial [Planctomycetaceae bacterium]